MMSIGPFGVCVLQGRYGPFLLLGGKVHMYNHHPGVVEHEPTPKHDHFPIAF